LKHIHHVAEQMGLAPGDPDLHGSPYIAELRLEVLSKLQERPSGR